MNLELFLDHASPAAGRPLRLRALFKLTGRAPEGRAHVPMSLALVLDRSGSMAGDKLRYAKEAAALLIRRIWPDHALGVVSYDSTVAVLAAGARGDDHMDALRAVEALTPGGTTNLSGGWLEGERIVREALSKEGVNRVLLLTDGHANVGITDPVALQELCRQSARRDGITTTTIGFGQGFNEDLLQAMADAGDGASYYIENPDQAPGVFEEEVEGLLALAAQNVTVEVEPQSGVRLGVVRHAYPLEPMGSGARIRMGDLYATEPRLLLIEFELEDASPGTELEVATLRARANVLESSGGVTERTIELPVGLVVGEGPRVDPEVRRVAILLDAGEARKRALDLEREGRADEAVEVLRESAGTVAAVAPDNEELQREAEDLRAMAVRVERAGRMEEADVKYMKQRVYDDARSRSGAKDRYSRGGDGG